MTFMLRCSIVGKKTDFDPSVNGVNIRPKTGFIASFETQTNTGISTTDITILGCYSFVDRLYRSLIC